MEIQSQVYSRNCQTYYVLLMKQAILLAPGQQMYSYRTQDDAHVS